MARRWAEVRFAVPPCHMCAFITTTEPALPVSSSSPGWGAEGSCKTWPGNLPHRCEPGTARIAPFTMENGAIRAVPGSHRWGKLPGQVLQDPSAPHPGELLLTGKAGSVVVMNAHMWHGGTANRTSAHRRAMHAFYTRWDKPQQQYQKRWLRPGVQARLS